MASPLAIAGPAALLAGAAWLNAKGRLHYDYTLIRGLITASVAIAAKEKRDRLNLFYDLEQHATAKSTADLPFLMYEGRTWTFKEGYDVVLKYAAWLKNTYAIAPREVVAMDFMNSPQFIFLWMGIWSLGAMPAFINYNLTGDPLLHSIKTSTARILFVDPDVKPKITPEVADTLASPEARDGKGPVQTVFFDTTVEREILNTKGLREPDSSRAGVKRSDMAQLIYTSGTTGLPKPAVVAWGKPLLGGRFMAILVGMKKTDRFYSCMPLYHSSASLLGYATSLINGNAFVIGRRFSTHTFWPEVRQHNATIIQYVGETCRYLLAAPPQIDPATGANLDRTHSVKAAFGNGLRPDVWERFKTRFGIETIGEFYGSTEGFSATWNLSSNTFTSGAIGRNGALSAFILSFQLAIVEVDWTTEFPLRDPRNGGFCRKVKPGKPGELLFKIDPADINSKFQGYFNNPAASQAKILRDVLVKGDAYFRTGDVLRWDSEGRWWFCDRIGDTFRWKSENVSTAEVSEALGTHPAVLEANVYGVEVPNHDGRAGCAAVLLDEKMAVDGKLMEELARHVRGKLPKYAVPTFLRVVTEVKTTGNNKQQKAVLRAEGVEPGRVGTDRFFWLRESEGAYVEFREGEWAELKRGRVKL